MSNITLTKKILNTQLEATDGKKVSLSDFAGKNIVLYFYPKDDTPGCTQEGIDFRDSYAQFEKLNTVILGVSKDTITCHHKFKAKFDFPFLLLADVEQTLCQAFDVIKEKSMYGKKYMGIERSTFLIDTTGKLCHEWRKVSVTNHVENVLTTLKKLVNQ